MAKVHRSQAHQTHVPGSERKSVPRAVLVGSELAGAAAKKGIHPLGQAEEGLRQHKVSRKIPHEKTAHKVARLFSRRGHIRDA